MERLVKILIVVLLVWWAWKWWKHRKAREKQSAVANAEAAAFGASTRVGSDLGSSTPVESPPGQALPYQEAYGTPGGGMPVLTAPTLDDIFSVTPCGHMN